LLSTARGKKEEQMLDIIQGMADNVVAVSATGKVTGDDYDRLLIPLIEGKLRTYDKIRLLYVLGPGFDGFTAGAMWDDAKIGLKHLTAYERIAVVTDVGWVAGAVKFFAFTIPCPVRVFGNDWLAAAKSWLAE
jgi:SpoIIAA-like